VRFSRRNFLHLAAGAVALSGLLALTGHSAWSQTRTIKIVVPFAPGGGTDVLARLLGEQIGRIQVLTMIVENRPGAGTVIATEAVARAAPDGNTVLVMANSFVINPHLRKLNYDPLTSFLPVCNLVNNPLVIVVNNASPYRTLSELLNAARAKPGELTFASAGPATTNHIAIEALKRKANVNMTYVPYPGTAPAVNSLLGEHVTAALVDYGGVSEHLKVGKLRALATPSRMRIEQMSEVPTVAESGYRDYEQENWNGVVVPARTSQEMVSQLAGWFSAAVRAPEVKPKLFAQGFIPVGTCGADFAALLRKQYEEFGRIIREANIKGE